MGSIGKITPFLKKYWVQIVVALAAMLVMSITDLLVPRQIQTIIDEGIANNDTSVILKSSLLMIGLTLMSLVLAFVNTNLSVGVSEKFAADWRLATFRRIQLFSFDNLDKLQTGELLVRLTSDISIVKTSIMMTMRIAFRAPLLLIGSIAMLVITSPRLALCWLSCCDPWCVDLDFQRQGQTDVQNSTGKLDRSIRFCMKTSPAFVW